jgi:hypothetical protein
MSIEKRQKRNDIRDGDLGIIDYIALNMGLQPSRYICTVIINTLTLEFVVEDAVHDLASNVSHQSRLQLTRPTKSLFPVPLVADVK